MRVLDYIKTRLTKFTETSDNGFDEIYELINNRDKSTAKKLLIYTDKILNEILSRNDKDLKYSHFHFEGTNEGTINLLAEFVVIKLFFYGLLNDAKGGPIINTKIKALETDSVSVPMGLSGKSTKWKKILTKRSNLRKRHSFYRELLKRNPDASLFPNTLVNILQRENNHFIHAFEVIPFGVPIEEFDKESSYVLLNTEKRKNSIDEIKVQDDKYLLDHIENIVLFDCEQKQIHRDFNYNDLSKWNESYASSFRNLIVFSFNEEDFSFNRLFSRIERVQSRFYIQPKYPDYETYSILPDEIDVLLGKRERVKCEPQFLGDGSCSFWQTFKSNIGLYEGLYELRSLKMMNIYSLVLNEKLKNYVLDDIFSKNEPSKILLEETKKSLLELSEESIAELRTNLSSTLEAVINSNIGYSVMSHIDSRSILVLPEPIYNNEFWKNEICDQLGLSRRNTVTSWNYIDLETSSSVVILDYRDLGKFPYRINPNIFETTFFNSQKVTGIFLAFFFKNKWAWTRFSHSKDLIKILRNPIREKHFDWDNLSRKNQQVNLEKEEFFDWDFESILQRDYEYDYIKVKYNPKKSKVYPPAELFILKSESTGSLQVMRLADIETPNSDSILKMQQLDEIYSGFNLYEKLANVEREKREIQIIRDRYNLDRNDGAGRLWKILLKRRSDEKGIEMLYNEMRSFFTSKGLGFVSLNTFENSWLNPESDSLVTRGKKVFFHLCEYLGLEKTYVGIMLRIKNAEVQASRNSNKQMNDLLADLINDGCFNDDIDLRERLTPLKERYIRRHDFDQIAVEENKVTDTLITLVELLKPEIHLEQVEKIERTIV